MVPATADPAIFLPSDWENTVKTMLAWIACNKRKPRDLRFSGYSEGVVYDDGVLKLTAYRTTHEDYSYAFLVEAEGKRVLFTGGLSADLSDFPVQVLEQPLDLAICEAAHFDATAYVPIFRRKKIGRMCITHYSPKHIDSIALAMEAMPQIPACLALDNMEIFV